MSAVQQTQEKDLSSLGWEVLPYPPYSPDLVPKVSICFVQQNISEKADHS